MRSHFILYVADQTLSSKFYQAVLGVPPSLSVPGMTEFALNENSILGLMPEDSLLRLFGDSVDIRSSPSLASRCEVYLIVSDASVYHARALIAGAIEVSPLTHRDWGHRAAYSRDLTVIFWPLRKRLFIFCKPGLLGVTLTRCFQVSFAVDTRSFF